MKGIFGIVSCDVIDSTSLEMDELIRLRKDVYSELFPISKTVTPVFGGEWFGEIQSNVAWSSPSTHSE